MVLPSEHFVHNILLCSTCAIDKFLFNNLEHPSNHRLEQKCAVTDRCVFCIIYINIEPAIVHTI